MDFSRMTALVVDDNDFMRDLVANMLREIGFYEIHHAADGQEALRKTQIVNPGVIICDVDMEPMDGLTFVEKQRAHQQPPPAPQIPILLLTSHSDTALVQRAIKAGVNAYVVKPVKRAQLEARILTVFERLRGGTR